MRSWDESTIEKTHPTLKIQKLNKNKISVHYFKKQNQNLKWIKPIPYAHFLNMHFVRLRSWGTLLTRDVTVIQDREFNLTMGLLVSDGPWIPVKGCLSVHFTVENIIYGSWRSPLQIKDPQDNDPYTEIAVGSFMITGGSHEVKMGQIWWKIEF